MFKHTKFFDIFLSKDQKISKVIDNCNTINLEQDIRTRIILKDSIIIDPHLFAINSGIDIDELIVDNYQQKYLKYKNKYITLKNSIN